MKTKQLTQKEILANILVTTKYTLKVLGGFVISGVVSVFGLYPLVESFFTSETALYITIVGFIGLLILIDSIKRNTLSRYYNSKLKNIILGSRVRKSYLNISIMSILFVLLIDGSGTWLTGVSGAKYYTENKAIQTEEYRNIEAEKNNDSVMLQAYQLDLKAYEKRESDYRELCKTNLANGKWRDPVAQNMNTWYKKNPRPIAPKFASSGERNKEFNSIKDDNKSFLDEYLQYIIFIVLLLLTGLLQYLTISEIKEDYEDLEDSLTPSRVTNIKTALATAQDIEEQHEKKIFQDKGEMQKKKYEQHRDMEQIGDKREIVFNAKAIKNGNEGLQLIASSNSETYVPHEESKAGHVINPFFSSKDKREGAFYDMEKTIITYDDLGSYEALTLSYMDEQVHLNEYLLGKAIYYFKDTKEQWSEITFLEIEDFIKSLNESDPKEQNNINPLNESVITDRKESEPLTDETESPISSLFTPKEKELINILWDDGTIKQNKPLIPRDEVLKIIGDTKNNTTALRDLYKKLIKHNYAFRKVAYFAKTEHPLEKNNKDYDFNLGEF